MTRLRRCPRAAAVALSGSLAFVIALCGTAAAEPQAIERLRITPAAGTITVGDSLQLSMQALDERGSAIPGAIVRFNAQAGRFSGRGRFVPGATADYGTRLHQRDAYGVTPQGSGNGIGMTDDRQPMTHDL